MYIEIYPLDKVIIGEASIRLGMERSLVEALIGRGTLVAQRYYYFQSEMAIAYDKEERVEFIEFLGGPDGLVAPNRLWLVRV